MDGTTSRCVTLHHKHMFAVLRWAKRRAPQADGGDELFGSVCQVSGHDRRGADGHAVRRAQARGQPVLPQQQRHQRRHRACTGVNSNLRAWSRLQLYGPLGRQRSRSSSVTSDATAPVQGVNQTEGSEQVAAAEALGQPVLPQQQRHQRRRRACKGHNPASACRADCSCTGGSAWLTCLQCGVVAGWPRLLRIWTGTQR